MRTSGISRAVLISACLMLGGLSLPHATAAPPGRDRTAQAPNGVDSHLPIGLGGIGVVSANDAWIVGASDNSPRDSLTRPSEEHWDGQAWATWGHPRMGKRGSSLFAAVDVIAHDDVWAVGTAPHSWSESPLMMHFNGTIWTRETPQAIRGIIGHFTAVADAGPNDIWMVGLAHTAGSSSFLAVHWDGEQWKRVETVEPGGSDSTMSGVCVLANGQALAVGTVQRLPTREPVAEIWDGTQWKVEKTADLQRRYNSFSGVTCQGDEAWAVGTSSTPTENTSLVEHRTADGWVRLHEADQPNVQLSAVTALATGDVWAVGYQSKHGGTDGAPLVEHGVGGTWTATTVPYRHAGATLTCVAADAPDDVWVAGNEGDGDGRPVFVDHWDGSTWTRSL